MTIDAPTLTPAGPVEHVDGNHYRRRFRAGPAGVHPVSLAFDGFGVRTRPRILVRGAPGPPRPPCGCSPRPCGREARIRPGSRWFRGTIRACPWGPGRRVSVALEGLWTAAEDLGDGRYRAYLTAPANPGVFPLDVRVDGLLLAGQGSLEAGGAPNGPHSLVYMEEPVPNLALNPDTLKFLVTVRDVANRRLGPATDVQVSVQEDPATPAVTPKDLGPNAMNDGAFWFLFQKQGGHKATGTLTVTADGQLLGSVAYEF